MKKTVFLGLIVVVLAATAIIGIGCGKKTAEETATTLKGMGLTLRVSFAGSSQAKAEWLGIVPTNSGFSKGINWRVNNASSQPIRFKTIELIFKDGSGNILREDTIDGYGITLGSTDRTLNPNQSMDFTTDLGLVNTSILRSFEANMIGGYAPANQLIETIQIEGQQVPVFYLGPSDLTCVIGPAQETRHGYTYCYTVYFKLTNTSSSTIKFESLKWKWERMSMPLAVTSPQVNLAPGASFVGRSDIDKAAFYPSAKITKFEIEIWGFERI